MTGESEPEFKPRGQCPYCLGLVYANTDAETEGNMEIHVKLAHPWAEVKVRKESAVT